MISPQTSASSAATPAGTLKADKNALFRHAAEAVVQQKSTATEARGGLAGTMSTMAEVNEKMLERGEKLSKLSERTADLSNNANEFARLAKQLKDQQKNSWF